MKELIIILIGAALVNNVVLSQFLGLCPFLGVSKKVETAAGMGGAVIFVITIASLLTSIVYKFVMIPFHIEYLQTIVFILIIAALVQFIETFMKKNMPALYTSLGIYLPLITTNCAVLGVCISNTEDYTVAAVGSFGAAYVYAILQGFGGGLGFWFAMMIMAGVRTKLQDQSAIPKAFQGVPIILTTAAILSLAFMGFSGMI